jgi:Protein of unknown function (DUF1573)
MNKNFKLFALLMLFFHTGIANVNAQPLLKFDVDTAQFGKVYAGDTFFYDFGFTNIGNEDLIIKQAWPACGCTTPTFTEGAIKPGERGVIKVQFRSAGFAGQTMVKQIIVINNGAEKYAVFKVKVVDKAIEEDILKHKNQTKTAEPKKKKKKSKSIKFKPMSTPEF